MKLDLKPVGFVRNGIKNRSDMPHGGTPSVIQISAEFKTALKGIEKCSHIWVLCWFDRADRTVLKARPRKVSSTLAERGVFAMRSPDRPNPIALTCARLVKIKGLELTLDSLDAADGTPVMDIKPYSQGLDCVPAATVADFSAKYRKMADAPLARMLARFALNHVPTLTPDALKALALVFGYIRESGLAPECGAQAVESNAAREGIDILHAMFGLKPSEGKYYRTALRGTATLAVKTKTGWITVEAGTKELAYFKKLL